MSESSSALATYAVAPSGETAMPARAVLRRQMRATTKSADLPRWLGRTLARSSSDVDFTSATSFAKSMTATRSVPELVTSA